MEPIIVCSSGGGATVQQFCEVLTFMQSVRRTSMFIANNYFKVLC